MNGVDPGGSKFSLTEMERRVREVPNFPREGISFKDITPLIEDGEAFRTSVDALARATDDLAYDRVISAEARGFVFGTALAYRSGKGLILARKPNRLPRATITVSYELEYGANALEIHEDAIPAGCRVLVVDDLLATGGTARAMCQLVENAGGQVAGAVFLIELTFLGGRDLLAPHEVLSLISYGEP
jgi:adenine phosphoribosyltransferase